MPNQIMVIAPYWLEEVGTWVFDDPETGLCQEPFVSGVPIKVFNSLHVRWPPFPSFLAQSPFQPQPESVGVASFFGSRYNGVLQSEHDGFFR